MGDAKRRERGLTRLLSPAQAEHNKLLAKLKKGRRTRTRQLFGESFLLTLILLGSSFGLVLAVRSWPAMATTLALATFVVCLYRGRRDLVKENRVSLREYARAKRDLTSKG